MTVTGKTVHKRIAAKIREVETEHSNLGSRVYEHENQIEGLMGEREGCYSRLAEIYLPELNAESIKQTLKEMQSRVESIFQEKQRRRRKLEESMEATRAKRQGLNESLEDITEQLNKKASERDGITGRIAAQLRENPDYTSLAAEAEKANARLEQNKERAREIESESKEKLPAYESNKLFMYLVRRKFGTDDYQAAGLIRRLDEWVAGVVDYAKAKKNYDRLRSMPELMRIEVGRRQEEFSTILEKVRKIEKEAAEKHGLPAVIEEGTRLGKTREEIMSGIKTLDETYNDYSRERERLESTKGEYHQKAIQGLKAYLKGEDIGELMEKAMATPTPEDEELVEKIRDIDGKIKSLKHDAKRAKVERDSVGKRVEGLNEIERRFRDGDYEAERSYFDAGFDINALLIGYILGRYSSNDVWSRIEDQQHFRPRQTYYDSYGGSDSHSSRRSSSYGSGGGFFSGGGFGGGGFSSGGGFGGGGFSSGKGF